MAQIEVKQSPSSHCLLHFFFRSIIEEKAGECPRFRHARISPIFKALLTLPRHLQKPTCSKVHMTENFPFTSCVVKAVQSSKKGRYLDCRNPRHSHAFFSFNFDTFYGQNFLVALRISTGCFHKEFGSFTSLFPSLEESTKHS